MFECIGMSGIEEEEGEDQLLLEEDERPPLAAGMLPNATVRAPRRSRGGKGRKGSTAGSAASSYSGMAFSYAVSSSPPAANAPPPVTPTARRGSNSNSSGVSPPTSTQGSANFSPVDRFAQQNNTSFESYVSAQSPTDFQQESRSSFGEGFGLQIGLENLSPTNNTTAPTNRYLQSHPDSYSPSEMYSHTQARSPLDARGPAGRLHLSGGAVLHLPPLRRGCQVDGP